MRFTAPATVEDATISDGRTAVRFRVGARGSVLVAIPEGSDLDGWTSDQRWRCVIETDGCPDGAVCEHECGTAPCIRAAVRPSTT